MRTTALVSSAVALTMVCLSAAPAQQIPFAGPSLLPIPATASHYPLSRGTLPAAYNAAALNQWYAASDSVPRFAAATPVDAGRPPGPADLLPPAPDGPYSPGDLPLPAPCAGDDPACCSMPCDSGGCTPCCPWYGGVYGLIMTRDRPNRLYTSYEDGNNANQLLHTGDLEGNWSGGGGFFLGRSFCCNQWAVEFGAWTLDPLSDRSSITHPNNISTPLDFGWVEFSPGEPVLDWFNNAAEHRLWRRDEISSAELNVVFNNFGGGGSWGWTLAALVGVGYFEFDEMLRWGTLDAGGTWGGNGGRDEAYLTSSVDNQLLGAQLGFRASRCCTPTLQLFVGPRFGVYNNHIEHRFSIYQGDGTEAYADPASGVSGRFPVTSSKDVTSLMASLDFGLAWQFAPRWSATIGYRVIAVSHLALADEQIPFYLVDLPEIENIDTNGDLILHGAFLGLNYSY